MRAWIVITGFTCTDGRVCPYGQKWNGQFGYYMNEHNVELFFDRRDAQYVLDEHTSVKCNQDRGDFARLISVDVPFVANRSIGVAALKWGWKAAKNTGYYPSIKALKEWLTTFKPEAV